MHTLANAHTYLPMYTHANEHKHYSAFDVWAIFACYTFDPELSGCTICICTCACIVFVINCFIFLNQIPDSPRVSSECVDLLRGLLERDPQCRMSFDQFFDHSFIDLDHMPSGHSIEKAVSNTNQSSRCGKFCPEKVVHTYLHT